MKITREELLKIATISKLEIKESEFDNLLKQLQSVLTYAERVRQVAEDAQVASSKNINVMREDVVSLCDPAPILAQAPERGDDYFIVPKIL